MTSLVLRRVAPAVSLDGGCRPQLESQAGLLVFAPCTQLTFLGAYIYFWMTEKSEQKEVGIVDMLTFL